MSIDEKMPITRRFVLANACFEQWSLREIGETLTHDHSRAFDAGGTGSAFHGRWIDFSARCIIRDFHSAPLEGRNSVDQALSDVDPGGKRADVEPCDARRDTEEE